MNDQILNIKADPEAIEVDPNRVAVVVVDMQKDFCREGGLFDKIGKLDGEKVDRVTKASKKVIKKAREVGIKIVYIRMGYRADYSDAGGPESPNYWKEDGIVEMHENPEEKGKFVTKGSKYWEIIDELEPKEGDVIVDKNRYSAFPNTDFNAILQTFNIKYLVFVGLATNVCVESTLRDAYFDEYFPILVKDACGNAGPDYTQAATIWNVKELFGWVTTSEDFVEALSKLP